MMQNILIFLTFSAVFSLPIGENIEPTEAKETEKKIEDDEAARNARFNFGYSIQVSHNFFPSKSLFNGGNFWRENSNSLKPNTVGFFSQLGNGMISCLISLDFLLHNQYRKSFKVKIYVTKKRSFIYFVTSHVSILSLG